MVIEFRRARCDAAPGSDLLGELIALLNQQYPGRAKQPGSVTNPEQMVGPHGAFLVGYDDETPIAIGGVRRLDEGICEIKRMYVVPEARSRGVGRSLLGALEDAARELGYTHVRLDAGPAQQHSRSLFQRTGYDEIPRYNTNHIAIYFAEKRL